MIPESSLVPDGLFLTTSREHAVKKNNLSNNLLLSRSPGESGISGASPDTPGGGGLKMPRREGALWKDGRCDAAAHPLAVIRSGPSRSDATRGPASRPHAAVGK